MRYAALPTPLYSFATILKPILTFSDNFNLRKVNFYENFHRKMKLNIGKLLFFRGETILTEFFSTFFIGGEKTSLFLVSVIKFDGFVKVGQFLGWN